MHNKCKSGDHIAPFFALLKLFYPLGAKKRAFAVTGLLAAPVTKHGVLDFEHKRYDFNILVAQNFLGSFKHFTVDYGTKHIRPNLP